MGFNFPRRKACLALPKYLADGPDTKLAALNEIALVALGEVDYNLCWRSIAARFKISFARLGSRFSCSKRRISAGSSEVTRSATLSSLLACRTHELTDLPP